MADKILGEQLISLLKQFVGFRIFALRPILVIMLFASLVMGIWAEIAFGNFFLGIRFEEAGSLVATIFLLGTFFSSLFGFHRLGSRQYDGPMVYGMALSALFLFGYALFLRVSTDATVFGWLAGVVAFPIFLGLFYAASIRILTDPDESPGKDEGAGDAIWFLEFGFFAQILFSGLAANRGVDVETWGFNGLNLVALGCSAGALLLFIFRPVIELLWGLLRKKHLDRIFNPVWEKLTPAWESFELWLTKRPE